MLAARHADGRICDLIAQISDVSELVALRRAAEAALNEFTRLTDALSMAGGVIQSAPTVSLNGGDVVVLKGNRDGQPFSKTVDLRATLA